MSAFFAGHGGGIEAVAWQLARRLPQDGATVLWMAGGAAADLLSMPLPQGLQVQRARSFDLLEHRIGLPAPFWTLGSLRRLWRAVGHADVVHVHDYLYQPTLAAMLFATLRRRPIVLTQHIGEVAFASTFARHLLRILNRSVGALALRSADQVVFVGRPVQEYFEQFVRFRERPRLLPNGVDHDRYRPVARSAPSAQVRLLFVGRFVEKKGLRLLHHCVDFPAAIWSFIGWGPLAPPSGPNVNVLGRLVSEEIVKHYQQADLLVLPSTGEGFPLVLQEALACGTPVLVSTEVFEAFPSVDPECVFHVELRVAYPERALRERLGALLADPARLAAARGAASALARQWSWSTCVDSYRSVYDEVCERGGGQRSAGDSTPREIFRRTVD